MFVPLLASAREQIDYVEVDTIYGVRYYGDDGDGMEMYVCEDVNVAAKGYVSTNMKRCQYKEGQVVYLQEVKIKTQGQVFSKASDDSGDNNGKYTCIFRGSRGIMKKNVFNAWQSNGFAYVVVNLIDDEDFERLEEIGTLKSFEVYDSKGEVILSRTFLSRAQPFRTTLFSKYVRAAKSSIDFYIEYKD